MKKTSLPISSTNVNSLNQDSENIKENESPERVVSLYERFAPNPDNQSDRHTKALRQLFDSSAFKQMEKFLSSNPFKSLIDSVNEQNRILQEQVEKHLRHFREIEKIAQSYTEKIIEQFKSIDLYCKNTARDFAKPFLDATFRNFKWMVQYLAEKKNLAKKELKEFLRKIFSSYKLNKLQSSFIEFLNLESFGTNPKTSSRLEIFLLIQSLSISR